MSAEAEVVKNDTGDSSQFEKLKIQPTNSVTAVTNLSSDEHAKLKSKKPKTKSRLRFPLKWPSLDSVRAPKLPILSPDCTFIIAWKCFILCLLIYSVLEIPYSMAFSIVPTLQNPWMVFSLIIDIFLMLDIVIKFRTMYIDKFDRLRLVDNPKLIARRYLKTWFLIDSLSSFPFAFVIISLSKNKGDEPTAEIFMILKTFRLLKLMRIFNLFKMLHVFTSAQQTYGITRVQSSVFRLIKILCLMILTAHIFACVWWAIGSYSFQAGHNSWIDVIIENGDYDKGNFVQYSYAFYWAIVTLFTTGYGDITAGNIYEQWAASVGIIFGSCLFAYFIGVLTTELTEDMKARHDKDHVEKAIAFCSFYELPRHIRRAVLTHVNYFNSNNYTFDHEGIMQALPNYVQADIERHLRKTRLKGLDIFHSLPDRVVGQIALRLKLKSVGAGKVLFYEKEIGHEIYIQRYGESVMKRCSPHHEAIRRQFGRGDVIGMDVMLTRKRPHTVVCVTYSEFYVLQVEDIRDVLFHNYKSEEAMKIWKKMKHMVASPTAPRGLSIVSEDIREQKEPPQHVHLQTVRNFEQLYVPRIAKDESRGTPRPARNASSSTVEQQTLDEEEYEQKLLEDEEREEAEAKRRTKRKKSIGSIFPLFPLNRESSDLKNEQIKRHHRKRYEDSSSLYYVSTATHDLDQDAQEDSDAEPFCGSEYKGNSNESMETQSDTTSVESAGWMQAYPLRLDDDAVNSRVNEMAKLRRATKREKKKKKKKDHDDEQPPLNNDDDQLNEGQNSADEEVTTD